LAASDIRGGYGVTVLESEHGSTVPRAAMRAGIARVAVKDRHDVLHARVNVGRDNSSAFSIARRCVQWILIFKWVVTSPVMVRA
jgi:hypothetical protein